MDEVDRKLIQKFLIVKNAATESQTYDEKGLWTMFSSQNPEVAIYEDDDVCLPSIGVLRFTTPKEAEKARRTFPSLAAPLDAEKYPDLYVLDFDVSKQYSVFDGDKLVEKLLLQEKQTAVLQGYCQNGWFPPPAMMMASSAYPAASMMPTPTPMPYIPQQPFYYNAGPVPIYGQGLAPQWPLVYAHMPYLAAPAVPGYGHIPFMTAGPPSCTLVAPHEQSPSIPAADYSVAKVNGVMSQSANSHSQQLSNNLQTNGAPTSAATIQRQVVPPSIAPPLSAFSHYTADSDVRDHVTTRASAVEVNVEAIRSTVLALQQLSFTAHDTPPPAAPSPTHNHMTFTSANPMYHQPALTSVTYVHNQSALAAVGGPVTVPTAQATNSAVPRTPVSSTWLTDSGRSQGAIPTSCETHPLPAFSGHVQAELHAAAPPSAVVSCGRAADNDFHNHRTSLANGQATPHTHFPPHNAHTLNGVANPWPSPWRQQVGPAQSAAIQRPVRPPGLPQNLQSASIHQQLGPRPGGQRHAGRIRNAPPVPQWLPYRPTSPSQPWRYGALHANTIFLTPQTAQQPGFRASGAAGFCQTTGQQGAAPAMGQFPPGMPYSATSSDDGMNNYGDIAAAFHASNFGSIPTVQHNGGQGVGGVGAFTQARVEGFAQPLPGPRQFVPNQTWRAVVNHAFYQGQRQQMSMYDLSGMVGQMARHDQRFLSPQHMRSSALSSAGQLGLSDHTGQGKKNKGVRRSKSTASFRRRVSNTAGHLNQSAAAKGQPATRREHSLSKSERKALQAAVKASQQLGLRNAQHSDGIHLSNGNLVLDALCTSEEICPAPVSETLSASLPSSPVRARTPVTTQPRTPIHTQHRTSINTQPRNSVHQEPVKDMLGVCGECPVDGVPVGLFLVDKQRWNGASSGDLDDLLSASHIKTKRKIFQASQDNDGQVKAR